MQFLVNLKQRDFNKNVCFCSQAAAGNSVVSAPSSLPGSGGVAGGAGAAGVVVSTPVAVAAVAAAAAATQVAQGPGDLSGHQVGSGHYQACFGVSL